MKRCRPSGPVPGAFVPADRAPREDAAGKPELGCALACEVECRVAPAQSVSGSLRRGVGEHRQDEALGVRERVAVVARTGQAFRGNRALLSPRTRLECVKEREADRLLELGITVELDVGAAPELVEVGALLAE